MAGCGRAYVCHVMKGHKPCSQRLWNAIVDWLDRPARRALREMAIHEINAA